MFCAWLNQHGNHCQMALVVLMHQMHHHLETAAVYALFRRSVKMHLYQPVGATHDRDAVAFADIDLHRMPVVDNAKHRLAVIEFDRFQIDVNAVVNINR